MSRSSRSTRPPASRSHPILSLLKAAAYSTSPKMTFAALHPKAALRWTMVPYDLRHGYAPRVSGAVAATLGVTIGLLVGRWVGRRTGVAEYVAQQQAGEAAGDGQPARRTAPRRISAAPITRDALEAARARARGRTRSPGVLPGDAALTLDTLAVPQARVPGSAPVNSARPDPDDETQPPQW